MAIARTYPKRTAKAHHESIVTRQLRKTAGSSRPARQVVMKAKQQLTPKRLSKAAQNVLLRQIPQIPNPCRRRKKIRPKQATISIKAPPMPACRPQAKHGYLLRSRSMPDHDMCALKEVPQKSLSKHRLKSMGSSHDSGIDSVVNTSDSEDSNVSAYETSASDSGTSCSSPLQPPTICLHSPSSNSATVCTVDRKSVPPASECSSNGTVTKISHCRTDIHVEKTTAAGCPNYSFTSVTDNFLTYGSEDIPDFLQDIDEVINADVRVVVETDIKQSSSIDDSSHTMEESTTKVTHEISLCHEQLNDSSYMDIITEKSTYLYTASACELEFVTEIFRGVQRVGQGFRPPAVLPPKTRSCPKYTLVLDLDETLVHCFTNEPPPKFDYHFTVDVPDASGSGETTELAVFARLRPFVKEFLERVAKKFEVVVFTASMKNYSSKMLDLLDPRGVFIKHRFYRDHCVPVGCSFVKDLSIFTRDLSKLIIVDNQIASFAFQIDNGIPIRSWVGDDDDRELLHLANFLENIAETEDLDVRQFIRDSLRIPAQLQNHVDMYYSSPMSSNSLSWSSPTTPSTTTISHPLPSTSSPIFSISIVNPSTSNDHEKLPQ